MHRQRKLDHIKICLEEDVNAPGVSTGFERYRFVHRALPETSKENVETGVTFFGKALKAPVMISAITGGTGLSARINKNLAAAAQSLGLAMAVGSQRPAIEDDTLAYSYQVRDVAPDIVLFANLGAVQLNYGYGVEQCQAAVEMIQADGLVLHLNALQECIQPRGNTNFEGLVAKIGAVCAALPVPVVVKEVGCGISGDVALALMGAGVSGIDVAGVGGTSWALVEKHRAESELVHRVADAFADWGIPTATSLEMVRRIAPELSVIASGGIRNGVEAAKAIALGADVVGLAAPLLEPAMQSAGAVRSRLEQLLEELRIAMFCIGARDKGDLRQARLDRI
ncbi:MAG: type 2 isopentenyl-diphosphate Delta-isomerase [Chloroflexi bacterium]|nr:type 2 isopentenyl-diphosphate Delta-isomerase [Chloroflexota bacterium]